MARNARTATARAALAVRGAGRGPRARADHRLHLHPNLVTRLLDCIDRPQDLHGLTDEQLQQVAQEVREHIIDTVGEIGGHFGANLGTCELAVALHSLLDSPTRQDPVGRRPPGLSAQGAHRPPRRAGHHPPVRGPGALLRDPRVRARHHGRRPRLDVDRLRGRPQGGDAPARRGAGRAGPRRRGDRRRRHDRRRGLRGHPPGRRPGHADGRRPQRQRHVDRAERRRALSRYFNRVRLEPQAVPRPRGRRGAPDQAPGGHRRRLRAHGPAAEGVDQGVLGARTVLGGARLGLHGRHRRP